MRAICVVVVAVLMTACGEMAPTMPSGVSRVVETGAAAAADVPRVPAEAVYSCVDRKAWTDAYIATHRFDTAMVALPSGELVYIDWQRDVYHVSGPTCRLVDY